jgi:1-phosphatidylinositol-4-phosphate 5-kinase
MHFVVMGNIFAQSLEIQERYDLKGSVVGRTVGEEKLKNLKSTTILKDLDFHNDLILGPQKRDLLFNQLDIDCEFLQRQDIMDYSLLLGVHSRTKALHNNEEVQDDETV